LASFLNLGPSRTTTNFDHAKLGVTNIVPLNHFSIISRTDIDSRTEQECMDAVKAANPKRTTVGNHLHQENVNGSDDFEVPKVDMAKAAAFKPSRVSGKHVMWLVTFVAGMGVSCS
jgi:hypothetical protein